MANLYLFLAIYPLYDQENSEKFEGQFQCFFKLSQTVGSTFNTGRGATNWENRWSEIVCVPANQGRVKLFAPLLRVKTCSAPTFSMAKTPSYHIKITPKRFVLHLQHG